MNIYQPVLVLNAAWQPINTISLKRALEDMNSKYSPKLALKIEYHKNDVGTYDFDKPTELLPLEWDKWIQLNPREFDEESIHTINMEIRLPTVVITKTYNKIPKKTFRPTKKNLYERYGGKCVWTGDVVPYSKATIEHMTPKSRGGDNTWKNLAIASPEMNYKKSNKTTEEFGVKPKYNLNEPKPIPASIMIKAIMPDWAIFICKS
jgi:5-methylcytosine-specific restriction endonuclease McrA